MGAWPPPVVVGSPGTTVEQSIRDVKRGLGGSTDLEQAFGVVFLNGGRGSRR
jgi:hypothetical protein